MMRRRFKEIVGITAILCFLAGQLLSCEMPGVENVIEEEKVEHNCMESKEMRDLNFIIEDLVEDVGILQGEVDAL